MVRLERIEKAPGRPQSREITDEEAGALARAVVNLFQRWALTDRQATVLLGELSPRTWARWKKGEIGRIPRDLKTRMSLLMGIHKALRVIFGDPVRAWRWIHQPNTRFDGRSALEVMLGGEITDLMRVRDYLDAERGGW